MLGQIFTWNDWLWGCVASFEHVLQAFCYLIPIVTKGGIRTTRVTLPRTAVGPGWVILQRLIRSHSKQVMSSFSWTLTQPRPLLTLKRMEWLTTRLSIVCNPRSG